MNLRKMVGMPRVTPKLKVFPKASDMTGIKMSQFRLKNEYGLGKKRRKSRNSIAKMLRNV